MNKLLWSVLSSNFYRFSSDWGDEPHLLQCIYVQLYLSTKLMCKVNQMAFRFWWSECFTTLAEVQMLQVELEKRTQGIFTVSLSDLIWKNLREGAERQKHFRGKLKQTSRKGIIHWNLIVIAIKLVWSCARLIFNRFWLV